MNEITLSQSDPIPISSCPSCEPDTWIIERDSKYDYRCIKCKRIVRLILKRKNYKESQK